MASIEQKKDKDTLKNNEELYRSAFEITGDGFSIIQPIMDNNGKLCDYKYLYVNDEYERQTGLKAAAVVGKSAKQLFSKVEPSWSEMYDNFVRTGKPTWYENYSLITKRWFNLLVFSIGKGKIGILFRDITERKKAEEELRKSEDEYSSLFANMIDGFAYCQMIFDDAGRPTDFVYIQINDEFERITGLKRNMVVGKKVTEAIPGIKEANPELFEIYGRVASTCQKEKFDVFFKPLRQWLSISVYCPKKGYFAAIFEDITTHKAAEAEVFESEKRLNRSQEIAHLGSWELDLTNNKLSWSDEVYRIFGLKPQEFGATYEAFLQATHPDDRKAVDDAYSDALREGKDNYEIEHRVVRKSTGEIRIVHEKSEHIRDENGKIIRSIGMVQDITERKILEAKLEEYSKNLEKLVEERTKQLKHAERLAAIGATAGMVGHDIRNPLQAIIGDVFLLKKELTPMPESETKDAVAESLDSIEKNIDYINKIVQDLQDYARPLNPNPGEADLKLIIEKITQKNGIPENIKVSVKVENDAKKFIADADYLNRILYNLVTNALQAMPKGGKLTIHVYKEANNVVITVKDTGVGIPKAIQSKMFTPMFTTKSKGQGFGLPVVKRMTESLGGTVSFESEEGKGTTFEVRLPAQKVKS